MERTARIAVGVMGMLILLGVAIYGISEIKSNNTFQKGVSLGTKKVYLITKGRDSAFWRVVYSGAKAACAEYNYELVYIAPDSEEDYETQNKLIREAVENDAEAIVFSAIDFERNAKEIDEAVKKGVKVVNIDSEVNSDKTYCYIGTDNYSAGKKAGEAVPDYKDKKAKVGIVSFMQATENGKSREQGVRDAIGSAAGKEVVESIHIPSNIEATKEATVKMLKDNPDINCIVALNEILSVGAGKAVEELNLSDSVDVIAFDTNVESVNMMEEGVVDALIVQDPYAMGYLGVENTYYAINGENAPKKDINTLCEIVRQEDMYTDSHQKLLFGFEQ